MSIPLSQPSLSLEGKVAIVTGGGTGIGRGIALQLARAGTDVVVAGRTLETLESVAEEGRALGRRCLAVLADVSRKADVANLVARTVDEFGAIDILVNNAGIGSGIGGKVAPWLLDLPEEHWDMVLGIDLKGPVLCCQAAGKRMIERRQGAIINISSTGAFGGTAISYGSAKAGVIRLTKGLARDLGPYNIRVNAIAPGYVLVPAGVVNLPYEVDAYDNPDVVKRIPLGRIAEPEDVGTVAVFLASEAANYITGHTIIMDGGLTPWP